MKQGEQLSPLKDGLMLTRGQESKNSLLDLGFYKEAYQENLAILCAFIASNAKDNTLI